MKNYIKPEIKEINWDCPHCDAFNVRNFLQFDCDDGVLETKCEECDEENLVDLHAVTY